MAEKEVAEEHITIKRRIVTNSESHEKKQLPLTPELIEAIETQAQPKFEELDEFQDDVKKKLKPRKKAAKKKKKSVKKKAKPKKAKTSKKSVKTTSITTTKVKKKKSKKKKTTKKKVPKFKELQKAIISENVLDLIDHDKLDEASELSIQMLENIRIITKKDEPSEEDLMANEKYKKLTKKFDLIIEKNQKNIDAIEKTKEKIKNSDRKPPIEKVEVKPPPIRRPPMPVPRLNVEVDKPPPIAPKKNFMQKLVEFLEHLFKK